MATPKLRFKEFDGYLEKNNLINLTLWASGGTPSKKNKDYWMGDIPLISGASMHTRKICESEFNITDLGLKKGSKLAPKNSILILVRGSMLFKKIPMGMALKDVAFNQDVKSIITKEDLNEYYFFQWLLSQENIIQNKVTSTGIGAGKLDTSELQNLEIYYPAKEEQTKIATFLSAVDTKIDELTQKHELLTDYKKGMMQQIFSQKLRFKGFSASWNDIKVGRLGAFNSGGTPSKKNSAYWNGDIPWISSSDLTEDSIFEVMTTRYITREAIDNSATKIIPKNSVLIVSRVGVGKVAVNSSQLCTSQDFTSLTPFNDNPVFLAYLLKSKASRLLEFNQGTSIKGFVRDDLINLSVSIPTKEEQTKIANFLTAIDQRIDNVAEQIDHAKTWKKGLLQQMFV